jgi:uncharacterized membrane protein
MSKPIVSEAIVIAFADAAEAVRARADFVALQQEHLLDMADVVVVTRTAAGRVELHQAVNMTAAGAMGGTLWGMMIGLLLLNPLLGAAGGTASGALGGALSDIGIEDGCLREAGSSLDEGGAALAVFLRKFAADRVLERLGPTGGRVLQTSLPHDIAERLRAPGGGAGGARGPSCHARGRGLGLTPCAVRARGPASAR